MGTGWGAVRDAALPCDTGTCAALADDRMGMDGVFPRSPHEGMGFFGPPATAGAVSLPLDFAASAARRARAFMGGGWYWAASDGCATGWGMAPPR